MDKRVRRLSLLNILVFLIMVAVNALASILPINGMDTGAVSDAYPNLFAPAPITFAIWGVIYAMLLLFVLSSHELFLKSDSYFLSQGEPSTLYLFNGTFDSSENAITTDRITGARITGPNFEFLPEDSDYYEKGKATYLKLTPGEPGTYVAGISTLPRMIELNAAEFKEYLEHEGLGHVISERKKKGLSDAPAREKYSKHVKAILQVDQKRTGHFSTELGYPIEFVALKNPYELEVGDRASFKLLVNGEPLAGQAVNPSIGPQEPTSTSMRSSTARLTSVNTLRSPVTTRQPRPSLQATACPMPHCPGRTATLSVECPLDRVPRHPNANAPDSVVPQT